LRFLEKFGKSSFWEKAKNVIFRVFGLVFFRGSKVPFSSFLGVDDWVRPTLVVKNTFFGKGRKRQSEKEVFSKMSILALF